MSEQEAIELKSAVVRKTARRVEKDKAYWVARATQSEIAAHESEIARSKAQDELSRLKRELVSEQLTRHGNTVRMVVYCLMALLVGMAFGKWVMV